MIMLQQRTSFILYPETWQVSWPQFSLEGGGGGGGEALLESDGFSAGNVVCGGRERGKGL